MSSLNIEIKPNTSKNKYWQCERTLNNDNNNSNSNDLSQKHQQHHTHTQESEVNRSMSDIEEEERDQRPSKRPRLEHQQDPREPETEGINEPTGEREEEPQGPSSSQPSEREQPELSERLRKVMLCTVCLDLPHPNETYQCSLGHIVCEDCVTRLLAEAALNQRDAQCPHCRTRISWAELSKNLAVGQTLWELSKKCPDCEQQLEYKFLEQHLKMECGKRAVNCRYRCLGCPWHGCHEDSAKHEAGCEHSEYSGLQILPTLHMMDDVDRWESKPMGFCYRALSANRIYYEDLELHWPQHVSRLSYELRFQLTPMFAFEKSWRLRVKLIQGPGEDRRLSYSLKLISEPRGMILVKYFATLPALYVQDKQLMDVVQQLNEVIYTCAGQSDQFKPLPMRCALATYRLLAMPKIMLRLWMILD